MTARRTSDAPARPAGRAQAPAFVRLPESWLDAHAGAACALLYAVALALRLLYLADFQGTLVARVPLMDEAFYRAEAWNIVRGVPLASDAFFMTPLYPYFLSVVFRLVGDGPLGAYAVQLALGALAAPLTFIVARRAVRPVLAFAAALGIASFAPVVFFEALFLVEGLVLLAVTASVAAAVTAGAAPAAPPARLGRAALSGACLGIAVLGRGSNLLLAPVLAAWFAWSAGRPWKRAARVAAVFLATLGVVLAPLLVHNAVRAGHPLLLTANAGFNLYVGNGPDATGIFVLVPGLDLQQDPLTLRYVQRAVGRPLAASEVSAWWTARTRQWVREHPGRTFRLFLWKLLLFWNRMSIAQVEGFEAIAPETALADPPFWRSFGFLPLALLGTGLSVAGVARRSRRGEPRARVRAFLAVCALAYAASIAVFFVTDRYRVPILPCAMVLAAVALESMALAFAPGQRLRLAACGLALGVLAVLTDPARLRVDRRRLQRDLHVHAALRSAAAQRFDAAVREYRAALALDPANPDVRDGMARMLARAGQDSLALGFFRDLLRDQPDDGRAWYNFGNFCRRRGRHAQALAAFRRAVELDPDREAAWNHLGETHRALGDTAAAAAAYRRALAVVPAYDRALNNLAALRAQQGDGRAAEAGFRAALDANPRCLPALVNLGILLTDSGRHAEAVAVWRRALAVDPGHELSRRALRQLDPMHALPARGATGLPTGDED